MSPTRASPPLTVVFAMLAEGGHYTGTFRLARRLRERGHQVLYLGLACSRELVREQGFEFRAFAEDLLPANQPSQPTPCPPPAGAPWRNGIPRRRRGERRFREFLRRIEEGELDACIQSCRPGVLLCDTFVWYVALRAHRLGIPTVNLSVVLSSRPNRRVPPIVTALPPSAGTWSGLRTAGSWAWLGLNHCFSRRLASFCLGIFRAPTRMHHLTHVFRRIARHSGYPCRRGRTYWVGEMGPRLALPEIVLCPRAFQLPGAPDDQRAYIGEPVDLERLERPLSTMLPPGDGPLIYCSLGSSAHFYPHRRRFVQAVEDASRMRSDWRFLLHLSDAAMARELKPAANLAVRECVPQLSALRQSAAMVTHGGLNSILECVEFGVPMVIVPALRDQPGNALRASRLGLGRIARMDTLTGPQLAQTVEEVIAHPGIRENLLKLKRAMATEPGVNDVVQFIESFAEAPEAAVRPAK